MAGTLLLVLGFLLHCGVATLVNVVPWTGYTNNPVSNNDNKAAVEKLEVQVLEVKSDIRFRYAHTVIHTRVANPANISQEVYFSAVLPETAFIAGFLIEVDGQVHHAYVKEKEAASQDYREAVAQGRTAAHASLSARDSNRFTLSVNVEPQKKVTFNLTYEELLTRTLGAYKHVINLDPGQIVRDLSVEVRIEESSDITTLAVPALRTSNEIDDDPSSGSTNDLATVERPTPQSAVIKFAPTPEQQRELASEGIKGQLVVEYDVNRTGHPGEVLVSDGYFVHFFAPTDLAPLSKQVTFVLDVSGSMSGRKIEQLREAMTTILGDLNAGDSFSLVMFAGKVYVWDPTQSETQEHTPGPYDYYSNNLPGWINEKEELSPGVVVPATPENVLKAKELVKKFVELDATNIHGALMRALQISKLGHSKTWDNSEVTRSIPEPIIFFLTDGQPNVGLFNTSAIVTDITAANTGNSSSIFSLALGTDADLGFLKKLSLRNTGFARKIYEASDTALQLRDFYRQVASPLLANVTFQYQPDQVETDTVTKISFRRYFSGSELVVTGRLHGHNVTGQVQGRTYTGSTNYPFNPTVLPTSVGVGNSTRSFMERLWAYITIQQLLEDDQAKDYGQKNTSAEKQRALDLALRYSFVTPLTSLVVVKPNDSQAVDPQDASFSGIDSYASGSFAYPGISGAATPGGLSSYGHPAGVAALGAPGSATLAAASPLSSSWNTAPGFQTPHQNVPGISYPGGTSFGQYYPWTPLGTSAQTAQSYLPYPVIPIIQYPGGVTGGLFYPPAAAGGQTGGSNGGTYPGTMFGNGMQIARSQSGGMYSSTSSVATGIQAGGSSIGGIYARASTGTDAVSGGAFGGGIYARASTGSGTQTIASAAGNTGAPSRRTTGANLARQLIPSIQQSREPYLANYTDITWLFPDTITISFIAIDGKKEVLQVAAPNETNLQYNSCKTIYGQIGHCRHLRYCVLDVFTNDYKAFFPYLCRINSFAGVCCPDYLLSIGV